MSKPRRRRRSLTFEQALTYPTKGTAPTGAAFCGSYSSDHGIRRFHEFEEGDMGKYFIAWLLGVPAFVLVLIYLFFGR